MKGSFTGATADQEGAAARADGGTLFLDELGEMDMLPPLAARRLGICPSTIYRKKEAWRSESPPD